MASLMGIRKRLIVNTIEVVSDKGDYVMVIDRSIGASYATVTIRKASEHVWQAKGPSFSIEAKDIPVIASVLNGNDAEWTMRERTISSDNFTAEDVNEQAVEREVEARCSQLDIERAKAENIRETAALLDKEMLVQHMDGKHYTLVEGCTRCENDVRPGHGDGSLREDNPFEEMPSVDADNL